MKLRGVEKNNLENAIKNLYPSFSFDADAPQGQNRFSSNYLLENAQKEKFLLKIILKDKLKGNVNKTQALSEVAICKTMSSHYVVQLINFKDHHDFIFLQFPYLDGNSLKEYRDKKELKEEEVIDIGIGILRGISDLWRKRIVHQDIKPENIFICNDLSVKLLDFGSARFQISPFRGAARTNFAYSSPEQILASRPGNAEMNRLTLDDRLDVFATGLVLYYLVEGRHPFSDFPIPADAIYEGKAIPDFIRKDISPGLKRVILRMLDTHQLNRPNSQTAISFLEAKDITVQQLQNGGFYYCAINGINRFLKIKEQNPDLFDGVVIEASQIPEDANKKIEIRNGVKTVLIDPQTYLFQSPQHQSKKFKKLPYFQYEKLFGNMSTFLEKTKKADNDIVKFINNVVDFQLQAGATAIVPPFLYVKEFNDESWSIDQEISHLSINGIIEKKTVKPIVKGIAITQEILTSDQSRKKILEYLTSLVDKVEGYLILLDSNHSEVVFDEPWLKGAQDLFTKLLSTGKYVIWSKADFAGLVLASSGVSIAMGEMLKQRRFNIVEEKQNRGRKVPYYYVPSLFARATWPEALKALSSYEKIDELFCVNGCCKDVDFKNPNHREEANLATHMMCSLANQFKKYKKADGKSKMIVDIKNAKRHYELIKCHSELIVREALKKNIKPSTASFLESWLNTLNV